MGGLLAPTSGALAVDGETVYRSTEKRISRYRAEKIGFVFQSASLLPSLTVLENLLFPALFAVGNTMHATEDEAFRLLDVIGLADKADVYPYQLSGGESRRVSLVRALINKPEILLADEPTGDLDEITEKQVMDFLENIHKTTGATLILVTHNEKLAQRAHLQFRMSGGSLNAINRN